MNLFQTAKKISASDAARRLGLRESHKRWQCPFHDDHNPSMACYEDSGRFYCFSCHARGDAADLWARVTGRPLKVAAEEMCAAFGLQHVPESREEIQRRKRIDDVAMLPQAVWQDWHRVMVDLLQEEINAASRLLGLYSDPEGWVLRMALERMTRLGDESVRLQAIPPEQLAAEVAERRRGEIPSTGMPQVTDDMLREILEDRLRLTGMRLNAEERAYVYRTLALELPEDGGTVKD